MIGRNNIWLPGQKPPLGAVLDLAAPLAQSMAGCWLLNDGNPPVNLIGSLRGSLNGGTPANTVDGIALTNSANGYAVGNLVKNNDTACSVFAIIKTLSTTANNSSFGRIISDTNGTNEHFCIGSNGAATAYPRFGCNNSGFVVAASSWATLSGRFFSVCGTWDGATLSIYLDGKLNNTAAYTTAMTAVGNLTANIGARSGGTTSFAGTVKFCGVWRQRCLSAVEIMQLHDLTRGW